MRAAGPNGEANLKGGTKTSPRDTAGPREVVDFRQSSNKLRLRAQLTAEDAA